MKSKHVWITIVVLLVVGAYGLGVVMAGNLDSSADPASTTSYGLDDIYARLSTGAAGSQDAFAEPVAGPGSTMNTLDDIMAMAPELDNTNGVTASQVPSGTTFWGLTSGEWGPQTGTLEGVTEIVMYSAGTYDGNLGGRGGANTLCRNNAPAGLGDEYTQFVAFISTHADDEIRDMPGAYGVPTTLPIVGPTITRTLIANNWADLLDGTIESSLQDADVVPTSTSNTWWSGSTDTGDGSVDAANTCEDSGAGGWTDASGIQNVGIGGSILETTSSGFVTWMRVGTAACDSTMDLICIAY